MAIRGYLFDLDGTLVDSERESGEALARALQRDHGIAIEQSDRDYVIGRSWVAIYDNLKARYPQLAATRDQVIARTAELRHEVLAEVGVNVLPGARGALGWTRTFRRALVTGSARVEALQLLPHIGPDAAFDIIVAAEDVGSSKPSPEGYLAAMKHLELHPSECIIVEDSHAGITAGRAAGCIVIGVRAGNFGGWDQSHAHLVIDSLEAFTPELVEELVTRHSTDSTDRPARS
jgi:HAD superfamily hydrolase (TIGR01509 family)